MWYLFKGTWVTGVPSAAGVLGGLGRAFGCEAAAQVACQLEVTQSQKYSSPYLGIQPSSCPAGWEALNVQTVPLASLNLERPKLTAILSTSESKTFFHIRVLSHFIL